MTTDPSWTGTEGWTADRTKFATDMYAKGWSASQIARVLKGVSRNAVIGKLHRSGICGPKAEGRVRSTPQVRRLVSGTAPPKPSHPNPLGLDGRARKPKAPVPPPPTNIVPIARAALPPCIPQVGHLPASKSQCKFPVGDPGRDGFGWCSSPAADGKPYCAAHCAVCFQAPKPGRNAKDLTRQLRRFV